MIFVASLYVLFSYIFFLVKACIALKENISPKRNNNYMCVYKLKCKSSITAFYGVLKKSTIPNQCHI